MTTVSYRLRLRRRLPADGGCHIGFRDAVFHFRVRDMRSFRPQQRSPCVCHGKSGLGTGEQRLLHGIGKRLSSMVKRSCSVNLSCRDGAFGRSNGAAGSSAFHCQILSINASRRSRRRGFTSSARAGLRSTTIRGDPGVTVPTRWYAFYPGIRW